MKISTGIRLVLTAVLVWAIWLDTKSVWLCLVLSLLFLGHEASNLSFSLIKMRLDRIEKKQNNTGTCP